MRIDSVSEAIDGRAFAPLLELEVVLVTLPLLWSVVGVAAEVGTRAYAAGGEVVDVLFFDSVSGLLTQTTFARTQRAQGR